MIYIGTAGYSYRDWVGSFYPDDIKPTSMLRFYSEHFSFVELNSSYYHMPGSRLFSSINANTPDDFKVAVKLFKGFTHERNLGEAEAAKFMYSLQPIAESRKLACILAQFPYSFHYNQQNADYLKRLREWFMDVEINVEFRNNNWIRGEVFGFLKREKLGFVCVDEPRIKGLIGAVVAATSDVSYIRMHGRNAAKWYTGEDSERYDYLYDRSELEEWVPRIRELERNATVTLISFNNHPRGKAVQNAKMLLALLEQGI